MTLGRKLAELNGSQTQHDLHIRSERIAAFHRAIDANIEALRDHSTYDSNRLMTVAVLLELAARPDARKLLAKMVGEFDAKIARSVRGSEQSKALAAESQLDSSQIGRYEGGKAGERTICLKYLGALIRRGYIEERFLKEISGS